MIQKKAMSPVEILDLAKTIMKTRGDQYGPATICFERAATIATIVLGKEISPYDIAMLQVSLKLARIPESKSLDDHYVDLINYAAFGSHLAKGIELDMDANEAKAGAPAKRPVSKKEEPNEKNQRSDNGTNWWIDDPRNSRN